MVKPTKIKRISVTYPEDIATKLEMDARLPRRGMAEFIRNNNKKALKALK